MMDFSKNRFFFPQGMRVMVKADLPTRRVTAGAMVTVIKESHLPNEEEDNDLEVVVVDDRGEEFQLPAHYFRRP